MYFGPKVGIGYSVSFVYMLRVPRVYTGYAMGLRVDTRALDRDADGWAYRLV